VLIPTAAKVSPDDLKAITESARDLAYRQLDAQFSSSDNFDTKALGVLAFDGAALGAILAARDVFFERSWLIPAVLLLLSGVFALVSVQRLSWDDGPDPRAFYDDEKGAGLALGSAARADVDLISEFGGPKGSIAKNDKSLRRKSGQFQLALWTTVIAGVTTVMLIAVAK
jgi:hypothetical protein